MKDIDIRAKVGRWLAILVSLGLLAQTVLAGAIPRPTPAASPTPIPGNTIVTLRPGSIDAVVAAHPNNTTFKMPPGHYTTAGGALPGSLNVGENEQFIGAGAGVTILTNSGQASGDDVMFNFGSGFQCWNMTVNCNCGPSGRSRAFNGIGVSNVLIDGCNIIGWGAKNGVEAFPIFIFCYGERLPTNTTFTNAWVRNCSITTNVTGNTEGVSVVAISSDYVNGVQWTNTGIQGCTISGTSDFAYWNAGGALNVLNNIFIGVPGYANSVGFSLEPGSVEVGVDGYADFPRQTQVGPQLIQGNVFTAVCCPVQVINHTNGFSDAIIFAQNTINFTNVAGAGEIGVQIAPAGTTPPPAGFADGSIAGLRITKNTFLTIGGLKGAPINYVVDQISTPPAGAAAFRTAPVISGNTTN